MKYLVKLLAFCCLLYTANTIWAGYTFPPTSLKTHNAAISTDGLFNTQDLMAHHYWGTWIAYDNSPITAPGDGGTAGKTYLKWFNWNNWGTTPFSLEIDRDLDCMGIFYDNITHTVYRAPTCCDSNPPGCYHITHLLPGIIEIDMAGSESADVILMVCLVRHWDFITVNRMDRIYLVAIDSGGTLLDPSPRLLAERYFTYGNSWGRNITDVTVSRAESEGPYGSFNVIWTETVGNGTANRPRYVYSQRVNLASSSPVFSGTPAYLGNGSVPVRSIYLGTGSCSGTNRIDSVYDSSSDTTLIAVDLDTGATSPDVQLLSMNEYPTYSMTQFETISAARHPTIDSYPWTGGNDLAVAYESVSNGSTIGVKFSRISWSGSSVTSRQDIAAVSDTSATLPTIATYTGSRPEFVMWHNGGEARMAYGTSGSTTVECSNIEVARYMYGHPSSTDENWRPMVVAKSNPSGSLDGIYAIWADRNGSSSRIYGKNSSSVPIKVRTYYAASAWQNQKGTSGMCFTGSEYPFTPVSNLLLKHCGITANFYDERTGMLEFVTPGWFYADQAYMTRVSYYVYDVQTITGSNPPDLQSVYVVNHYDNEITSGEISLHSHDPITLGRHTYPNTNNSPDYFWRFWNRFPSGYNYAGFFIPTPTNENIWHYDVKISRPSSYIQVYYLDWY